MSDLKVEAVTAVDAEKSIDIPTKAENTNEEAGTEVNSEKNEEAKDIEANGTNNKEEDFKSKDAKYEKKNDRKRGARENGNSKYPRKFDDFRNSKKNSKYDPSILPETNDAAVIRNQVEFYFGDSNLPTDDFLWDMTDGATNLPVAIEKICSFGRMKRFKDLSVVVDALRTSSFLQVTGAEGQEQVNRKVAYDPTIPRAKAESRSIYAKGFGDEEPSSQFDIEAFFAPYGPTNAVRLRRSGDKLFKGSVFVEFDNDETAEKFLALDPKPLWKGKHELQIESKKSYTDKKNQEIRDGVIEPKETYIPRGGRGRGRGGRGHGGRDHRGGRGGDRDRDNSYRGDRDPDDWKRRREDDRANGFKDDRGGRDRDHKGRGRGRRDDRNDRNNDRNREREGKNGHKGEGDIKNETSTTEKKAGEGSNGAEPSTSEVKTEAPAAETNDKKRAREDNGVDESPALKKVDTKS